MISNIQKTEANIFREKYLLLFLFLKKPIDIFAYNDIIKFGFYLHHIKG